MNPLIFWHGWGMHPAVWDGLRSQLNTESLAPPLPGYMGTPPQISLDAVTDSLLKEVRAPVTLCAWSLGAILALHAAQRQPEKIARLILISATPSFVQRETWQHGMTPNALAEFALAIDHDPHAARKRFIALFNQGDVNCRQIVRDLNTCVMHDLPSPTALASGLALLRDTDLRMHVREIAQPTLLLHGAHDPLMPLAAAQWLAAALPRAQLDVLPDAAHTPFLSNPNHCAKRIAEFLHA